MKSFILSSLVFGLVLLTSASCSTDFGGFTPNAPTTNNTTGGTNSSDNNGGGSSGNNGGNTSNGKVETGYITAAYFPEPSMNCGCDASTLKSEMLSKGYTFNRVEDTGNYSFQYKNKEMLCFIVNGKYDAVLCFDLTSSEAQDIVNKYRQVYSNVNVSSDSYSTNYEIITNNNETYIYYEVHKQGTGYFEYGKYN